MRLAICKYIPTNYRYLLPYLGNDIDKLLATYSHDLLYSRPSLFLYHSLIPPILSSPTQPHIHPRRKRRKKKNNSQEKGPMPAARAIYFFFPSRFSQISLPFSLSRSLSHTHPPVNSRSYGYRQRSGIYTLFCSCQTRPKIISSI